MTVIAPVREITPAWAREFNSDQRHCWEGPDGTRRLDNRADSYVHGWDAPADQLCTIVHDPRLTGRPEWLRFIHAFAKIAVEAGQRNPFGVEPLPDGTDDPTNHLLIEYDGHPTSDGRRLYVETYLREHETDWGLTVVFRNFFDREAGRCRIECYDENLVGLCEQALGEVERSYRMEVTR